MVSLLCGVGEAAQLSGVATLRSDRAALKVSINPISVELGAVWFGALQKLAKPAEDGHKSLQKFSIVGASWFLLTPHISAWPYLVGLDMEVDSCQLEDFDFYLFLSMWLAPKPDLTELLSFCRILFCNF